ncbi:MAG: hypothetical protein H5T62_01690 [Anaerolineae bacterium]|nr:hypothetical protein [Anaerolineae bacterium]
MNREHLTWIGIVVALLAVSFLIGRQILSPVEERHLELVEGARPELVEGSFRQWFWVSRSLDLAVQVGLIFVGALGIAALLPRGREE